MCLTGLGTISIHVKRLQIPDVPRKQNKSIEIIKSLAHFNTQFRVKESSKILLAIKVKNTW